MELSSDIPVRGPAGTLFLAYLAKLSSMWRDKNFKSEETKVSNKIILCAHKLLLKINLIRPHLNIKIAFIFIFNNLSDCFKWEKFFLL